MSQIISIVDSYGYWPMVRQVFSHRVFGPLIGRASDEEEIRLGLAASTRVLDALETLIGDDDFLVGGHPSLADFHLAPMIAYFSLAPEGDVVLASHQKLSRWWATMVSRRSFQESEPDLLSS